MDGPLAPKRARQCPSRGERVHTRSAPESPGISSASDSAGRCRCRTADLQLDRRRPAPVFVDPLEVRARALRHALGFGPPLPAAPAPVEEAAPRRNRRRQVTVIVAGIDAELDQELRKAKFIVKAVDFTPFDAAEAAKIPFLIRTTGPPPASEWRTSWRRCARHRMRCSWAQATPRWRACLHCRLKRVGGCTRRRRFRYSERHGVRRPALHARPASSRRSLHRHCPRSRPRRDSQRRSSIRHRGLTTATRQDEREGDCGAAQGVGSATRTNFLAVPCVSVRRLPSASVSAGTPASCPVPGRRRCRP